MRIVISVILASSWDHMGEHNAYSKNYQIVEFHSEVGRSVIRELLGGTKRNKHMSLYRQIMILI